MIKILLGGSPCTHWSIAQSNYPDIGQFGEAFNIREAKK
jgi:site-specific DNA-cytosine methylase